MANQTYEDPIILDSTGQEIVDALERVAVAKEGVAIQIAELPTASATYNNKIFQYIGATTQDYINGYFYKCVEDDGSYSWEEIQVSEGGSDVVANPTGTATADLEKLQIGETIYGVSGGVNGSTITPINDIATWLQCAGLHQSYTTLNEVLADSAVLSALMASTNASDYLERSKTWITNIVSNSTAMNYIGTNNYCASRLLADETWRTAICNSTYFESVLNVKVPTVSSSSSSVIYSTQYDANDYAAFRAFDGNNNTRWNSLTDAQSNSWVGYNFGSALNVWKCFIIPYSPSNEFNYVKSFKIQGSNDNSNWVDISEVVTFENKPYPNGYSVICNSNSKYQYIRAYVVFTYDYRPYNTSILTLQFYGRSDVEEVPDIIDAADISSIATNEPNATASRDYKYGEYFYKNGKFCTCTASSGIARGATFTLGTNYVEGTVADVLQDKVIYATSNNNVSVATKIAEIWTHYQNLTYKERLKCYICLKQNSSNINDTSIWYPINTNGLFQSVGNSTNTLFRFDVMNLATSKCYLYDVSTSGVNITDYSTYSATVSLILMVKS